MTLEIAIPMHVSHSSMRVSVHILNTQTRKFVKDSQMIEIAGIENPNVYRPKITIQQQYTTGKPISANVSIGYPGKAKVMAWLIDRRIQREQNDSLTDWEKRFAFDGAIDALGIKEFAIQKRIPGNEANATEFTLRAAGRDWYVVAGKNQPSKIIALCTPFAKIMIGSAFSTLAMLFLTSNFTVDSVLNYFKSIASFLNIQEIQIFAKDNQGSYPQPPKVWSELETYLIKKISKELGIHDDVLFYHQLHVPNSPRYFGFGPSRTSSQQPFDNLFNFSYQNQSSIMVNSFSAASVNSPQLDDAFSFSFSAMPRGSTPKPSIALLQFQQQKQYIKRENFIEIDHFETEVNENTPEITVSFKGTDAITEYDIVVFVIQETKFGVATERIQVKNPVFAKLKNVAHMLWDDITTVTGIVQNMSNQSLVNVKLNLDKLSGVELINQSSMLVPLVPANESVSVDWFVRATQVGNAKLNLNMEYSEKKQLI